MNLPRSLQPFETVRTPRSARRRRREAQRTHVDSELADGEYDSDEEVTVSLLQRRMSTLDAVQLLVDIFRAIDRMHAAGWAVGDLSLGSIYTRRSGVLDVKRRSIVFRSLDSAGSLGGRRNMPSPKTAKSPVKPWGLSSPARPPAEPALIVAPTGPTRSDDVFALGWLIYSVWTGKHLPSPTFESRTTPFKSPVTGRAVMASPTGKRDKVTASFSWYDVVNHFDSSTGGTILRDLASGIVTARRENRPSLSECIFRLEQLEISLGGTPSVRRVHLRPVAPRPPPREPVPRLAAPKTADRAREAHPTSRDTGAVSEVKAREILDSLPSTSDLAEAAGEPLDTGASVRPASSSRPALAEFWASFAALLLAPLLLTRYVRVITSWCVAQTKQGAARLRTPVAAPVRARASAGTEPVGTSNGDIGTREVSTRSDEVQTNVSELLERSSIAIQADFFLEPTNASTFDGASQMVQRLELSDMMASPLNLRPARDSDSQRVWTLQPAASSDVDMEIDESKASASALGARDNGTRDNGVHEQLAFRSDAEARVSVQRGSGSGVEPGVEAQGKRDARDMRGSQRAHPGAQQAQAQAAGHDSFAHIAAAAFILGAASCIQRGRDRRTSLSYETQARVSEIQGWIPPSLAGAEPIPEEPQHPDESPRDHEPPPNWSSDTDLEDRGPRRMHEFPSEVLDASHAQSEPSREAAATKGSSAWLKWVRETNASPDPDSFGFDTRSPMQSPRRDSLPFPSPRSMQAEGPQAPNATHVYDQRPESSTPAAAGTEPLRLSTPSSPRLAPIDASTPRLKTCTICKFVFGPKANANHLASHYRREHFGPSQYFEDEETLVADASYNARAWRSSTFTFDGGVDSTSRPGTPEPEPHMGMDTTKPLPPGFQYDSQYESAWSEVVITADE